MKNPNKAKNNPADYFRVPELGKKKVNCKPGPEESVLLEAGSWFLPFRW